MDKDRQIRFLYPPLFFVGFWSWALYLDPMRSITDYLPIAAGKTPFETGTLVGIVASGGVVVLVAGFLISTISVVLLRIAFCFGGCSTYEAVWSPEARERVSRLLNIATTVPEGSILYLAAVFDHVLLPAGIHTWLFRRWSAFNISAHSCVALGLVGIARAWSGLAPGYGWHVVWVLCIVALAGHAIFAWRDTMGLVEFYSTLDPSMLKYPNERSDSKPSQGKGAAV